MYMYQEIKRTETLIAECNAANEIMQKALASLLSEAENNLYAMHVVAEAYKTGSLLPKSEDMWYQYLEKMLNSDFGKMIIQDAQFLSYELDKGMEFGAQYGRYGDVYEYSEILGYAAFDLGLRDYTSSSATEIQSSLEYFKIGDTLLKITGAGIETYINAAKQRLEEFSEDVPPNGVLGNFVLKYQQQLAAEIEEPVWNRLDKMSKIFISTALFCYHQFKSERNARDGEIDYSPVISLLSKALELELRKRFYHRYLEYLKETFNNNAARYIDYNGLSPRRNKFLRYDQVNSNYVFVDSNNRGLFTLGDFPYAISNNLHGELHTSVIDFCKDVLFSHDCDLYHENAETYRQKISDWLKNYKDDVEVVRSLRNRSAHPNSILNVADADLCQNYIIRVQHLIDKLIQMCTD